MYQAIPLRTLIIAFGLVAGAMLIFGLWKSPPETAYEWLRLLLSASAAAATGIILLGNTRAFHRIWDTPAGRKHIFPFIAGEWEGTISSNWPVLSAMRDAAIGKSGPVLVDNMNTEHIQPLVKDVKVTITATLLAVEMRLIPNDNYSHSVTVSTKPIKIGDNGTPCISYIYKVVVPQPKGTDSQYHLGAAYLSIDDTNDEITITGPYWTNREWHNGINTAGIIKLQRQKAVSA